MNMIHKYKVDFILIICLIIFFILSIFSISSAQALIPENNLVTRQIIWYLIGTIVILFIMYRGNKVLYKSAWKLYIIGIITLVLVLLFGTPINDSRCWFKIPGIGNFQPSEFMKIILIIVLGKVINDFKEHNGNPTVLDEFKFLLNVFLIVLIPSILTFLEPDTGVVLIYLIITFIMLFISGIRYRWFIIVFVLLGLIIGFILTVFFLDNDLFIKLFGSSFFLRVDRILDWRKGSGYQLENGITAIGSGGMLGYGYKNTPIYFPEPQTDFIFAVFSNNFGFLGSIIFIGLLLIFDLRIIKIALDTKKNINKYVISGIVAMLIYQQFQNIGMTLGLLPITGITLPFISYGGSSLLSYMIMLGIVFNTSSEKLKYRN